MSLITDLEKRVAVICEDNSQETIENVISMKNEEIAELINGEQADKNKIDCLESQIDTLKHEACELMTAESDKQVKINYLIETHQTKIEQMEAEHKHEIEQLKADTTGEDFYKDKVVILEGIIQTQKQSVGELEEKMEQIDLDQSWETDYHEMETNFDDEVGKNNEASHKIAELEEIVVKQRAAIERLSTS